MISHPNVGKQDPQTQFSAHSPTIKRRQTQYFDKSFEIMPQQKQGASSKSPVQTLTGPSSSRSDLGVFLRKFEKPISDIQKFLTEYPHYEEQFLDHEKIQAHQKKLAKELDDKEKHIKQLEGAVAVFEGVHMNSSKALKEENIRLGQRLVEVEERVIEAENSSKASQKVFVDKFEKLIKDKNQELERVVRDQAASLEKQKAWFEKQHTETVGKNRLQMEKIISEKEKQNQEMEKLELINDGLKDRASKLKELQQEFSNIPDDVFKRQLKDLSKRFHLFCKARFMGAPEGSTPEQIAINQQEVKERLLRVGFTDRIPFFIPSGNTEASKLLRLAGAEHIISESLCTNIFRPVVVHECSDATVFEVISERLHKENPWKEAMWRTSTVGALEGQSNIESKVQQMVMEIFKLTGPLIREEDREIVKTELAVLFKAAFETWKPAQKNLSRIFATTKLEDDPSLAWESHPEQDDFFGASEDELAEIDPQRKVLCLFPRVYRERSFTMDKGVDPEDRGCIYFPGAALYADAGAYVVGQREHRDLQKLMEELSKKAQVIFTDPARLGNRRSRRPSVSKSSQLPLPPPQTSQSFNTRTKRSQAPAESKANPEVVPGAQNTPSAIPKTAPK